MDVIEQPLESAEDRQRRPEILVVDDQSAVAALSRRLQGQGFRVVAAGCGGDALDLARRRRPSLVLLALRLPDIHGLAVCEELSDCAQTWDIPVIILSEVGQPDIVRKCRAAGSRYFIRKPYDPNVLLVLINQAIEAAAGREGGWA